MLKIKQEINKNNYFLDSDLTRLGIEPKKLIHTWSRST